MFSRLNEKAFNLEDRGEKPEIAKRSALAHLFASKLVE
jgi:hypothetical protein